VDSAQRVSRAVRPRPAGDGAAVFLGSDPTTQRKACLVGIQGLIVLLWAWSWLPQLIDLLQIGRQSVEIGQVAQRSPAAGAAYSAIIALLAVLSVVLIVSAAFSAHRVSASSLGLLLAPWLSMNFVYVLQGGRSNETLIFPLVVIALAVNSEFSCAIYPLLRRLIIVTAGTSLILGLTQPQMYLSDPARAVSNDKALVGNLLLNGLMPTSNQLGILMALGIPLLAITSARRTKWIWVAVCMAALVWSASRTSLAAAIFVFAVVLIASKGGTAAAKNLIRPAAAIAGIATLTFPFLFTDPQTFSSRVNIWRTCLSYVTDGHLLTGVGTLSLREVSAITTAIGAIPSTGHNTFVTSITVGGLIAVTAVASLYLVFLHRATAIYSTDRYPLVFFLTLMALSVLEDPPRGFVISPSSFLILPLLAMPFAAWNSRLRGLTTDYAEIRPRGGSRRQNEHVAS
jgi:hypothetical protein